MNNLFIRTVRVWWPNSAVGGEVFQTVNDQFCRHSWVVQHYFFMHLEQTGTHSTMDVNPHQAVQDYFDGSTWPVVKRFWDVDNAIDMASIELHTESDETPVHACLWIHLKWTSIAVEIKENNKNIEASPDQSTTM
ncbi:hypothetical protein ASPFODRAFT_191579 [Aspergillus luchuensis CBS 106.47]|uniref:Uncharacterized protein n=1 Tax=Aspergillus luchuensis (strain CBS 106.47) TaxID=1137211 RepID=A0A1M3TF71_ASPLC|nr:hypothetical protein ASPFODRAFT_191579 [Aspergillus luchuensis CBS 106.47]